MEGPDPLSPRPQTTDTRLWDLEAAGRRRGKGLLLCRVLGYSSRMFWIALMVQINSTRLRQTNLLPRLPT